MARGHSNSVQWIRAVRTKDGKRQRVLVVYQDSKGVARAYLDVWQGGARTAPPTLLKQGTRGAAIAAAEAQLTKLLVLHDEDDLGTAYFGSFLKPEMFGLSGKPAPVATPAPTKPIASTPEIACDPVYGLDTLSFL